MTRDARHPVELLSAFADGETTEGERETIAAHLAGCEACRELLDDLRLLDRLAADEAVPPVPADLAARLRARLDAEPAPAAAPVAVRVPVARVPVGFRRGLPLAAAASLVVAALVWLLRLEAPHRDLPPGPPPAVADRMEAALPAAPSPAAPAQGPESTTAAAAQEDARGAAGGPESHRAEAKRPEAPRARADKVAMGHAVGGRSDTRAPNKESVAEQAPSSKGVMAEPLLAFGSIASTPAGGDRDEESGPPAVEAPPYRVRLLANRSMSVETAGYTCIVPVSQEDAVSLAAIVSAARIRQEGTVNAAAQVAPAVAQQETPSGAAGHPVGAPKAAIVAPRICAQLSPDDCRYVLSLVRDRYRGLLEKRCGPPPR